MTQTGTPDPEARVILDSDDISRAIKRIAHELLEANHGPGNLVLLGIQTRGVPLARRLKAALDAVEGSDVPQGELDITMYRDDLRRNPTRSVGRTRVPCPIDRRTVVLVDDVLFSGRTVVAALDALKDLGRPAAVRFVALVDRGHRELPVRPDHVGRDLPTSSSEHVRVQLQEIDGAPDQVVISGGAK